MTPEPEQKDGKPSVEARAQAAAWIARLHGPNRSKEVDAGLRRWLAEASEHAAAFELLTDTWEKSAHIHRRSTDSVASHQVRGFKVSFPRAVPVAIAVAVLGVLATVFILQRGAVVTGIGEQRRLTLEDGTRLYLNTDTRAVIRYDAQRREIILDRGEALFQVAKRADWPFVVRVSDREVSALGTTFLVRQSPKNLAVALIEGRVIVASDVQERVGSTDKGAVAVTPGNQPLQDTDGVFSLQPGQRLTLASNEPPTIDLPRLDHIVAWLRGEVAFDNTPLADAVAEMNRYSAVRLVLLDSATAAIRISGVFRVGDSLDFARALVRAYDLRVREDTRQIVLSRQPSTGDRRTRSDTPAEL